MKMKNIILLDHPIMRHKLGYLRSKTTSTTEFRFILKEVSQILAFEATRNSPIEKIKIETPIVDTDAERIINAPIVVSIMRAGNTMINAILDFMPFCRAGHIGIYRDKFIRNTVEYYFKLPDQHEGKEILLCDPMIATADTAIAAIDRLKNYEVGSIKILTILISRHGAEKIHHFHPDVTIYALSATDELLENGYLTPGMGDAGDRLFGSA